MQILDFNGAMISDSFSYTYTDPTVDNLAEFIGHTFTNISGNNVFSITLELPSTLVIGQIFKISTAVKIRETFALISSQWNILYVGDIAIDINSLKSLNTTGRSVEIPGTIPTEFVTTRYSQLLIDGSNVQINSITSTKGYNYLQLNFSSR